MPSLILKIYIIYVPFLIPLCRISAKRFIINFAVALFYHQGPFLIILLILIPAWISNRMSSKVQDKIAYPFPNFNICTIEVWEWINNFMPHFLMDVITYPCWDQS